MIVSTDLYTSIHLKIPSVRSVYLKISMLVSLLHYTLKLDKLNVLAMLNLNFIHLNTSWLNQ